MLRTTRLRTLIATLVLTAAVAVGASGCLLVPVGYDDDHHGWHHHDRYEHHYDYGRR